MTALFEADAAPSPNQPTWFHFVFGGVVIERIYAALPQSLMEKFSNVVPWVIGAVMLWFRYLLAAPFWAAGQTRVNGWSSQEFLFTAQHPLPLPIIGGILPESISVLHESGELYIMQPKLAAYLATGAEIILPILLIFGLLGRWAALGLAGMAFTILFLVANVPPHSFGFDPASVAQFNEQGLWMLLGLVIFVVGPGRISADSAVRWIKR